MIGCNVLFTVQCKLGQSKEESKDRFGNLALIDQGLLMPMFKMCCLWVMSMDTTAPSRSTKCTCPKCRSLKCPHLMQVQL